MNKEDFERMNREEETQWEPLSFKENLSIFLIWLMGVGVLTLIGMFLW